MDTDNVDQSTKLKPKHPLSFLLAAVEALLLLMLSAFAVFSIGEIVARQQFLNLQSKRVESLRANLLDQKVSGSTNETTYSLDKDLRTAVEIRDLVQDLIAVGAATKSQKLTALREAARMSSTMAEPSIDATFISYADYFLISVGLFPPILSSDRLVAILVICCAVIGSLSASLRADHRMPYRSVTLGLASGFVTYLAINGGKHFFLLQTAEMQAAFNPYTSAFAGLLTGLFTEKAYGLLAKLVDRLAAKIEESFK